MSFHRNVYDLLDLLPKQSAQAARMIRDHEQKHGPLPASVREWYCVDNIAPLTDRVPAANWLWFEYSNTDPPESLRSVLRRIAKLDDRPTGRLVRVMGECQNVGDWRVEFNGSDDPPVWSYDPYHRDQGEEYILAAATFSEFVWNWVAEFHQFYKRFGPIPNQPHVEGNWKAGTIAGSCEPVIRAFTDRFGVPERTKVGFGEMRYEFRTQGAVVRLTRDDLLAGSGPAALWMYAVTPVLLNDLTKTLTKCKTSPTVLRTSDTDYEWARQGHLTKPIH
jgi:hypothetical protein